MDGETFMPIRGKKGEELSVSKRRNRYKGYTPAKKFVFNDLFDEEEKIEKLNQTMTISMSSISGALAEAPPQMENRPESIIST